MKRIFSILFALLLVMAIPAPVAAQATWHVDDDGVQWPGAYTTINAAIAVASAGDTIMVHQGTYNEQVNVNKSVTVKGEDWPVVNGQPSAFLITGAGATVKDFDVRGKQTAFGTWNDIIAIGANNVTVQHNRVTGTGPYTTWQDRNPGPAISAILTDGVVIKGNRISNTSGAGIWFGSSTNGIIRDNHITDPQYTGILIVRWWVYGPSHDNIIKNNKVSGAGSLLVWDDGIRLGWGAYNNIVHDNRVTGSNASGIRAVGTTHDNTIENNVMRGNATSTGYDAYDQSSGSGTAGTANTWQHNTFGTASPAGLQ